MQEEAHNNEDYVDTPEALGDWLEANRAHLLVILQQKASVKLRSKVDADDLLQDAASRAVKSVVGMKLATSEVMPWFLQILTHTIVDAHRHHFGSQKRDAAREVSVDANLPSHGDQAAQLADLLAASITSPSQAFSQHVRLGRMQEALSQLPADARQAIHWRFMESLSSQEIAARLNKSDGAVRVLLSRTLKRLEDLLNDVRPAG
ncbi:MAG: sigma-70 family RNA polymerase sigma factor [Pirellulaceae bacterium]|nr:sigma-70 family RNA polymerase sigma factor [Pirellulaceae bacterium]